MQFWLNVLFSTIPLIIMDKIVYTFATCPCCLSVNRSVRGCCDRLGQCIFYTLIFCGIVGLSIGKSRACHPTQQISSSSNKSTTCPSRPHRHRPRPQRSSLAEPLLLFCARWLQRQHAVRILHWPCLGLRNMVRAHVLHGARVT